MNFLKNHVRELLQFSNVLQNQYCIIRAYAVIPENYPVPYTKVKKTLPYHPKKSGDLGLKLDVQPNNYCLFAEQSKELEDADELVKKMFMLKFLPQRETSRVRGQKVAEMVRRHKYDNGSTQVQVARMTCYIQELQEMMGKFPNNKKMKIKLLELIAKRNKFLKRMRTYDYKCFEWLIEKLNVVYRSPLENIHEQVTRKGTIRRLTDEYCQKIIQDKLDVYKNELGLEKKTFFKENLKKLQFIREQELAYGLPVTVTEEDIKVAEEKIKQYC